MAKQVSARGYKTDRYDSDTDKSLRTLKAVDFTEDCTTGLEKDEKAVLLFTRAKRGRIVVIKHGAISIHFFVDELDKEMRCAPRDDTFGSTARMLGLKKTELRKMIEQHTPA